MVLCVQLYVCIGEWACIAITGTPWCHVSNCNHNINVCSYSQETEAANISAVIGVLLAVPFKILLCIYIVIYMYMLAKGDLYTLTQCRGICDKRQ